MGSHSRSGVRFLATTATAMTLLLAATPAAVAPGIVHVAMPPDLIPMTLCYPSSANAPTVFGHDRILFVDDASQAGTPDASSGSIAPQVLVAEEAVEAGSPNNPARYLASNSTQAWDAVEQGAVAPPGTGVNMAYLEIGPRACNPAIVELNLETGATVRSIPLLTFPELLVNTWGGVNAFRPGNNTLQFVPWNASEGDPPVLNVTLPSHGTAVGLIGDEQSAQVVVLSARNGTFPNGDPSQGIAENYSMFFLPDFEPRAPPNRTAGCFDSLRCDQPLIFPGRFVTGYKEPGFAVIVTESGSALHAEYIDLYRPNQTHAVNLSYPDQSLLGGTMGPGGLALLFAGEICYYSMETLAADNLTASCLPFEYTSGLVPGGPQANPNPVVVWGPGPSEITALQDGVPVILNMSLPQSTWLAYPPGALASGVGYGSLLDPPSVEPRRIVIPSAGTGWTILDLAFAVGVLALRPTRRSRP
ncbi:MAG: hypothetical protein ACYDDF_13590 [Thermoplasmatota archaeon]